MMIMKLSKLGKHWITLTKKKKKKTIGCVDFFFNGKIADTSIVFGFEKFKGKWVGKKIVSKSIRKQKVKGNKK